MGKEEDVANFSKTTLNSSIDSIFRIKEWGTKASHSTMRRTKVCLVPDITRSISTVPFVHAFPGLGGDPLVISIFRWRAELGRYYTKTGRHQIDRHTDPTRKSASHAWGSREDQEHLLQGTEPSKRRELAHVG